MNKTEFFLVSSLEKVMPTKRPAALPDRTTLSAWPGTRCAVQLVYYCETEENAGISNLFFRPEITGGPVEALIRRVDLVPVEKPCFEYYDDDYISIDPGLFPDLLSENYLEHIRLVPRQYRSLWISWDIPTDAPAGSYDICFRIKYPSADLSYGLKDVEEENAAFYCLNMTLKVGSSALPKQTLIHSEWVHTDCLSDYYHVPVFSDEYWRITENFIYEACNTHGVNYILTPVFTPPLDTAPLKERPTVQLVDVYLTDGTYSFGFRNLERWLEMCRRCGIEYLEIPPFFTQWGVEATPKIVAHVDGEEKRIFGWDVPAESPEYRKFLCAFIPAIREKLCEFGYDNAHAIFQTCDEPMPDQMDRFMVAKSQLDGLLDGCYIVDAVGSVEFYKKGLIPYPDIPIDVIDSFLDAGVKEMFVYYCCAQGKNVPNRFIAMKSARNRIMGVLLYLYGAKGFCHWGYNFYYSFLSCYSLDPYRNDREDWCFMAGDSYLVYPGKDGKPVSSIRAEVQAEALFDLRALEYLESLTNREYVKDLIYKDSGMDKITFSAYPKSENYLLSLRERTASEIEKRLHAMHGE